MYTPHNFCRACTFGKSNQSEGAKFESTAERLIPVFDLGVQPLANDFRAPGEEHAGFAPLKVLFCPRCTLAQLSVVVDPNILYRNYAYVTSGSELVKRHFDRLWHDVSMDFGGEIKTVLEIGSNDGKFLRFAKENGAMVAGIDPAENLAKDCEANGVKTVTGFFDESTANVALAYLGGKPDCIFARHVMCHIDDWKSFIKIVAEISRPQTLTVIEVPYVVDLLNIGAFDSIYHEHLSYMSVTAMRHLLVGTPLSIVGIHQYQLHGGCLAIVLKRGSFDGASDFEQPVTPANWFAFQNRAKTSIERLRRVVRGCREMSREVVGFGASAKSTVWINSCGFTKNDIACITDNTKQKWYKFSPGSDIPIVDEGYLMRERPRYAIMFAWNYYDECMKTQEPYLKTGGQFIVPIPTLKIVPEIAP